jgi:glutamate--cysteine ligase
MHHKVATKEQLEKFLCESWDDVNKWIDAAQAKWPQPLTSSVDVRESRLKFAPVDHNMYPAGFNNICNKDLLNCSDKFRTAFDKIKSGAKRIGLLPESHTKNKYYLDHLYNLKKTIEMADCEVVLFSPDPHLFGGNTGNSIDLESQSLHKLTVHKAQVMDGVFVAVDPSTKFNFDLVVLNNDQSVPLTVDWESLKTPALPSPFVGWFRRQKIHHFKHYREVANEFASHFSINPDLIQAHFSSVEEVDFNTKEGLDDLAHEVDRFLATLPPESSVFVKASQGTYGMGISVVSSGEEIRSMNRKVRNKMDVGKNNLKFTSLLIQEGVETILKCEDAPAEVTIYLIDGKSIGGFMRTNPLRGTQANLNAQGMLYRKFCISDLQQDHDHQIKEHVYSIIARLSTLAASREMKDLTDLSDQDGREGRKRSFLEAGSVKEEK